MKVGFIGTGRMGQAMVRRLLDAKHEVGVYNRTPPKAKPLADAGAKIVASIADAARYGEVVYTMLADDAALEDVVFQNGGLLQSLPKGGIHVCAGTHGIPVIRKIKAAHADEGPDPGRRADDGAARAGLLRHRRRVRLRSRRMRSPNASLCSTRIGRRTFEGGADPEAATAHQDRQQLRARLRHRGDGRRLRAHAQVRRRDAACSTT